jgi:glycosyltransferase involved in cell wall biosynthesis
VDAQVFNPRHRDESLWQKLGVTQPHRLLYCGRVSVEKNLPLLVEAFKLLCARRRDAALIVAGDGPYLAVMKEALAGYPAYFLGCQGDAQLGPLYASSDLLVFPSRTDTLGQVVMEAQASGLSALVSNEGGPSEIVQDQVTGLVLPARSPAVWCDAMDQLLDDQPRRQRMARIAPQRMGRFSLDKTFAAFWAAHAAAARPADTVAAPSRKSSTIRLESAI